MFTAPPSFYDVDKLAGHVEVFLFHLKPTAHSHLPASVWVADASTTVEQATQILFNLSLYSPIGHSK